MIGNGAISSYGTHTHEHTVTKCLHETYDMKSKSGAAMYGGARQGGGKKAGWGEEKI